MHFKKTKKHIQQGEPFNPLGTVDLKFYQSQGLSTFWGFSILFFIKPVFYGLNWKDINVPLF